MQTDMQDNKKNTLQINPTGPGQIHAWYNYMALSRIQTPPSIHPFAISLHSLTQPLQLATYLHGYLLNAVHLLTM